MPLSLRTSISLRDIMPSGLGGSGGAETLSDLYHEIWIPANEMVLDVTAAPTAGTRQETTLQAAHYDYTEHVDGSDTYIYVHVVLPEDIDSSTNISLRSIWETDTNVNTETAVWTCRIEPIADGENLASTMVGNAYDMTDDAQSTANYLCISPTDNQSVTFNKGELACLRFQRDGNGAGDDLLDTARLIGGALQYKALGTSNAQWS